ncbi:MAG: glycosyltransferase family 2 protein [Planctomycetia bacterium]|nr:glycosyltransferase family 2 protein [Planctomycetia bacterium]
MTDAILVLEVAFWVCFALVFYAYVGYPVVIRFLASVAGRRASPPTPSTSELPTISLLVAAHNEASIIAARIANALAMDYPAEKLEIVVATDGCTDGTADVVRQFANRGVRVLEYPIRRGKATVLNDSIPRLKGEIVILSDANTLTEPNAARRLARWFVDQRVGVVCGRLVLTDPRTGSNADSMYWKYETFLKRCEGRLGALLGANGGIYAVRRSCFTPIPADTIVDDFVLPLQAKLRTGCSIVYDPEAVANEETPPNIKDEFRRRARIGAGGFQSLGRVWGLLNPLHGWVAFTFFSHKILRWACPFFLIGMLVTCVLLRQQPLYLGLLLAQVAFYALSALVPLLPTQTRLLKPLRLTTMFTGMNVALLLGFWRWMSGRQRGTWQRTVRTGEA